MTPARAEAVVPRVRTRSRKVDVEGFGCPRTDWPHHFRVDIPEVRGGDVRIVEDFGVSGHAAGKADETERCALPRARWNAIADLARREFNERLRALGLPPGAWKAGPTKVERMLGQELVLLACATAAADDTDVAAVGASWAALRPEERWWFAGWLQSHSSERTMRGAALLLSGGPLAAVPQKPSTSKRAAATATASVLPLFDAPVRKN